ncbi:MAG TPA: hypothetical protein VIX19_11495 [Terriglobales bacterium]
MMFVRYAAGDRAWHADGHYANLTIDDAWLTEPYGHLNYAALLREMEAHNFHTTIAFIPWNFDRSEPKVVQLFRQHADRYSICIHGNNHDHLEFGGYDRTPLSGQIADIQQGLARMERFRTLTSLPVDRVMIFPDEVAPPAPTLRALERYNFAGAANADVVPIGSVQPTAPLFFLRAVNLNFTSFPLVRRYSAEAGVSKALIAVNAFLDNSLLFYGHQSMFTTGINAFDPVAATVNRVQPDTRWSSLGSIAQHLDRVRLRADGNYDVVAYGSDLIFQNRLQRDVIYHVEKQNEDSLPIRALTIDGRPAFYELSGERLSLAVPVGAGESKHVVIEYQSDLNLASVDVSKKSPSVAFLRRISDFRDITMSRSTLGRALTRFYYQHHLDDLELDLEGFLPLLLVLAVVAIAAGWLLRKRARTRNLRIA